jgi:hypothetical protein
VKYADRLNNPIISYIALSVLFFILVIFLPANKMVTQNYRLDSVQYHILLFAVELPLAITWFVAFYGYYKLNQYAHTINRSSEEAGFKHLAAGCKWLAWGLVFPAIYALIVNAIANSYPGFLPTAIISTNYLDLIFQVIALTVIANGASSLVVHGGRVRTTANGVRLLMLLLVTLGVGYCFLIFRQLGSHSATSADNQYYLPEWLIVFTVIIPYIFAWFTGFLAAYEISVHSRHVKGLIYRRGLRWISIGLTLVITGSFGSQYIHAITPRTGHVSLSYDLVFVYMFYIIIFFGFALVSLGAYHLKKLEEV